MVTLLEAHSMVPDPHGDRAYADANFVSRSADRMGSTRTRDKPSDESKSTTTLSSDRDLSFSVSINARYTLTVVLSIDGDGSTPIVLGLSVPSGSAGFWAPSTERLSLGATTPVAVPSQGTQVTLMGSIVVGATQGSLALRWAPQTTPQTPMIIRIGSWLRVTRTG